MEMCRPVDRWMPVARPGLVAQIFPADQLLEKPSSPPPPSPKLAQHDDDEAVNRVFETSLSEGVGLSGGFSAIFATHDQKEGMQARGEAQAHSGHQ